MKSLFLAAVLMGSMAAPALTQTPKGLAAVGPYRGLRDKLMLFGQFVGDWDCEVVAVNPDGSKQEANKCKWHWGWVLEGRAIQDVWIVHPKSDQPRLNSIEYGTTLRVYDPKLDTWHCVWAGPIKNSFAVFEARQKGTEIMLETPNERGRVGQWIFSDITQNSFHW